MAKRGAQKQNTNACKYKPEYVAALLAHFDIDAGETREVENDKGDVKLLRIAAELPMYETFAREIGVSRETLKSWADAVDENDAPVYPEFRAAYYNAKGHQQRILVTNGLLGGYSQAFAIFTAKNILGWRDAVSHEHSGAGGSPIKTITTAMTAQEAYEAYQDTLKEGA